MYIIPAIDLRDGKCVRLIQGDYHRQITYHDDPCAQAKDFVSAGAEWLHLVDLDGAKIGHAVNIESIHRIAELGIANIEVGGGIRDEKSIQTILDMGAKRVIIGTKAVSDFGWFTQMAEKFPQKLVLGLDAKGSKVATHGWTQKSPQHLIEFAQSADKLPIAAIIYTDISRDGMLEGPNIDRTKALAEAVKTPVIASGGVRELADIEKLAVLPIEAVIVGRSLYEGTLDLKEAVTTAQKLSVT
ncbi:MAG: 1-(5-phosphoribosyl)-5-[(5-phosphoribosylamino)methylideneamino]imidazole-4-carboxamide isomerase [Phycisphaerae bacterium]|nr:1-(5-phosphoribosyl)-5-[(5-phosphoribosylamino)methylideneamino]imidazole-4-carboxamide isomerase [Phycisphaerae bacterium]